MVWYGMVYGIQVRTMCTQMLVGYPSCKFVVAVLHTLTHLSACSIVDIPTQVRWLAVFSDCLLY